MRLLLSDEAYGRTALRLKALAPDLEIFGIDSTGGFHRDGVALDAAFIDPEVYWVTPDLYRAGLLPQVFGRMFAGSSGRWAQLFNAGLDNPAFRALMAKGLRLTKSVAQAPAIAEYVMANVISLWHPLETQRRLQAEHAWASTPFREMSNSRWLMVGFGAIGGEIARRLQPFGAALTVVRRQVGDHPLASDVRALADLKELLPDADVVVLACALNEETRQIANTAFFAAMKPGAILVNIGRGGLVHEAALRAGLDQGRPGMAVLDVFEQEPLAPDAWFWDHPNIRMTAHCSNAGDGVVARGDRFFLENLKLYLEGRPLLHEADKSEVGL